MGPWKFVLFIFRTSTWIFRSFLRDKSWYSNDIRLQIWASGRFHHVGSQNPRGSPQKHNQQKVRTFSFRKHLKFLKSVTWLWRTVDLKITAWIRSGCLKIHVDLLRMRKSKSTNFQLSRTPKIIEIEPVGTENGPSEVDPGQISDLIFFLYKKRWVVELFSTPLTISL